MSISLEIQQHSQGILINKQVTFMADDLDIVQSFSSKETQKAKESVI